MRGIAIVFVAGLMVFIVSLFCVGCGGEANAAAPSYIPLIASEIGIVVATPSGNPIPTPIPGGKCENCGGDGIVGDGTIKTPCAVCDGKGFNAAPADSSFAADLLLGCNCIDCQCNLPAEIATSSQPLANEKPKVASTSSGNCSNGSCSPRRGRGLLGRR